MVKANGFAIICADVQAQMRRVFPEQILQKFPADSLPLAFGSHANPHQVAALGHLNMVFFLYFSLFLHIFFAGILDKECGIAYNSLSVTFARDYYAINI